MSLSAHTDTHTDIYFRDSNFSLSNVPNIRPLNISLFKHPPVNTAQF